MNPIVFKKKPELGICFNEGCFRVTKKIVNGIVSMPKLCSTCRSIKSRLNNLKRYAWNTLRMHSRERKIPFMLPFKHFAKWCVETHYHTKKGQYASSYTVDRINIDPAKGIWYYHISNIQKLTRRQNSKKRWLEYEYENGGFRIRGSERRDSQPDDYF